MTVYRDAALQQHTGSLQLSPVLQRVSLTLWGPTVLFHGSAQATDTLQTDTSQPKSMGGLVIEDVPYHLSNVTAAKH